MRNVMFFALILAFGSLTIVPSKAEVTYPWCARYADQGGGRACSPTAPDKCRVPVSGTLNCGFVSYEQCRAALSGNGGQCEQNPMFRPGPVRY